MISFYQVECPKCHGQLNSTTPLSGQTICPFCGTVFHITANMTKEIEVPDHMVPFATSISDFERATHTMLIGEDYAPDHISGFISFRDIRGFYLPVYLYQGKYECAWSCKVKQPVATDAGENQKDVYRPQNGVSKGDFAFVCLAHDGVESGKELAEYVRTLDYKDNDIKPVLPDDLNGHFFMTRNQDHQKVWSRWGEDTLNNVARKNALIQLQSSDIKDFKSNVSSDSSHDGQFLFFPVWMVNYQYDGEPHHIFMDGTGRTGVKGTTLIDRALKAKAEKPFMILKFIAVAAIVIPLLMLLAGWYLPAIIALVAMGLVFFGYRYYARWHKGRVIRKARKEREMTIASLL